MREIVDAIHRGASGRRVSPVVMFSIFPSRVDARPPPAPLDLLLEFAADQLAERLDRSSLRARDHRDEVRE